MVTCGCGGGRMGLRTLSAQYFHQPPILEWCFTVLESSTGEELVQFPLYNSDKHSLGY